MIGSMPLPPYIRRPANVIDGERYQTVFARERGAVAAPTAGLHFTESLLQKVRARGVDILPLTLHVGLGTFMPVRVKDLSEHRMHREYYRIPETTAKAITDRKKAGKRVIALGTTTTRLWNTPLQKMAALRQKRGRRIFSSFPAMHSRLWMP